MHLRCLTIESAADTVHVRLAMDAWTERPRLRRHDVRVATEDEIQAPILGL